METRRDFLEAALQGVGRIDIFSGGEWQPEGTGFLVSEMSVVTCRHVVEFYVQRRGGEFELRGRDGRAAKMRIGFRREHERTDGASYAIEGVRYLADIDEPDLAVLTIGAGGLHARPLTLNGPGSVGDVVATIGFGRPMAADGTDGAFGGIGDVKRLAPGKVTAVSGGEYEHDCTTAKGSSGSAVVSVETGEVVGMHRYGAINANRAVAASALASVLG